MKKTMDFLLACKNVKVLIGKTILYLVIPYAYLFLCGILFDSLLKWYFMTTFIFFSLIALYIVAIILIILMFVKFFRKKKRRKK